VPAKTPAVSSARRPACQLRRQLFHLPDVKRAVLRALPQCQLGRSPPHSPHRNGRNQRGAHQGPGGDPGHEGEDLNGAAAVARTTEGARGPAGRAQPQRKQGVVGHQPQRYGVDDLGPETLGLLQTIGEPGILLSCAFADPLHQGLSARGQCLR